MRGTEFVLMRRCHGVRATSKRLTTIPGEPDRPLDIIAGKPERLGENICCSLHDGMRAAEHDVTKRIDVQTGDCDEVDNRQVFQFETLTRSEL